MKARAATIKHNAKAYQQASKKVKTQMLDELSQILHLNRQYLASLLRRCGKVVARKGKVLVVADPSVRRVSKRGRKKVYGKDVQRALRRIWELAGFASSKHLVAFIRLNQGKIFDHPELKGVLSERVKRLLLSISPSTVDRLLKPYRQKVKLKSRYRSNPFSSQLKRSIRVEPWFEKPKEPGYVEVDLVHHSGASGKGDFIYTLTATEVSTGWTELRAIKNKAMIWTTGALEDIVKSMPVGVRKVHSDNGSEFINAHTQRFCRDHSIEFTRSRPYRKNDCPYVESKNWSLVRAYVGWRRYDTDEELAILDRLLGLIALRHNLFMPQMHLVSRERHNGKVRKRYEMDTPLNRVLRVTEDPETVQRLKRLRERTDIVRLSEEIERLSEQLSQAYETKLRRVNHAEF